MVLKGEERQRKKGKMLGLEEEEEIELELGLSIGCRAKRKRQEKNTTFGDHVQRSRIENVNYFDLKLNAVGGFISDDNQNFRSIGCCSSSPVSIHRSSSFEGKYIYSFDLVFFFPDYLFIYLLVETCIAIIACLKKKMLFHRSVLFAVVVIVNLYYVLSLYFR